MIKENIDFVFGAMRKMSESLQGSQKPTDHHNKPLWQQNLQSPQLPRPSGHHSQASWVANTSPSRRGAKEIQNLRLLAPYKNYPSGLGSYKMKFGGSPLPSTSHPARHRNPSTKKLKGFRFWFNFLI